MRLVVLALGGNSLIRDRSHMTVQDQYRTVVDTCRHVVGLLKYHVNLVITHGNGPQVGFILRRSDLSRHELHTVPLDSCVADTQGAMGYNIQMALHNELSRAGIKRSVASVVTQVVVDANDPAFARPSKPIGSFLSEAEAIQRKQAEGWEVMEDAGRGWRRLVPSPQPREIVEMGAIKALLERRMVVVAAGGGGIPVVRDQEGMLAGVEAVIDKDLASSLLARCLKADLLVISTGVARVSLNYGKPNETPLERMTVAEAEQYIQEGHFAPGSMLPKIQACIEFVRAAGGRALDHQPRAHLRGAGRPVRDAGAARLTRRRRSGLPGHVESPPFPR